MQLKTNQRVLLTLDATHEEGAARIDGPVQWFANPSDKVRIEPVDDRTAYAYGVKNGPVLITAQADADLDAGETRILSATQAIEVINAEAEASNVALTVGEPEEVES